MLASDGFPFTRHGQCSICHGPSEQFWHSEDWWHNLATDCDGRKTGKFVNSRPLEIKK